MQDAPRVCAGRVADIADIDELIAAIGGADGAQAIPHGRGAANNICGTLERCCPAAPLLDHPEIAGNAAAANGLRLDGRKKATRKDSQQQTEGDQASCHANFHLVGCKKCRGPAREGEDAASLVEGGEPLR